MLFRSSSAPLVSNEQFALGGLSGVRGYEEGEEFGDTGWRVLIEPRAPPFALGQINAEQGVIPITLRGSVFVDYGERYVVSPLAAAVGREPTRRMLGTGVAGTVNAGQHLELRLAVAWALLGTPASHAGEARGYFSLGVQF